MKLCVLIAGEGIVPYCAPVWGGLGGPADAVAAGGGGGGFVFGWGTEPGLCICKFNKEEMINESIINCEM